MDLPCPSGHTAMGLIILSMAKRMIETSHDDDEDVDDGDDDHVSFSFACGIFQEIFIQFWS